MKNDTRDFPIEVIASLSTGRLLCKFGDMQEAAEYLMGHPIWTHHFASKELNEEIRKTIGEQCPGMPDRDAADHVNEHNYLEFVAKLQAEFGKTVKIRKGGGLTAMLQTDGIPDHLKDNAIVVKV